MIFFANIRQKHLQKLIFAQLDVIVTVFGDIYALPPEEYHKESIYRDRILNAVRDDPACTLAYHSQDELSTAQYLMWKLWILEPMHKERPHH